MYSVLQTQFPLLSINQQQNIMKLFDISFSNNKKDISKLNNYPNGRTEWKLKFRKKIMLAYGDRRMYELIKYLACTPIRDHKEKYEKVRDEVEGIFWEKNVSTDVVYNLLKEQEYTVGRLIILLIDRYFLDSTLYTWGELDRIQLIWGSHDSGVSASTMRYGSHCLIKVNLFAFVSWIETLKVKKGTSIGNNNCKAIIDCIVHTVAHEMTHCFLQLGTPAIVDSKKGEILIREKDPFLHLKMTKKYKDNAYVYDNGIKVPYFVFGQQSEGPGLDGGGTSGGHYNTFMSILKLRFGQEIPQHNLYTVNYQKIKM